MSRLPVLGGLPIHPLKHVYKVMAVLAVAATVCLLMLGGTASAADRYIGRFFWHSDCRNVGDRGQHQGLWRHYRCRYGDWVHDYELWVW